MRTEVLGGQLLDLRISADESPDPAAAAVDAMLVNRYKTAAYTVERPLHLGAALGGATPATIDALRRYGTAIGIGVPAAGRPAWVCSVIRREPANPPVVT